MGPPDRSWMRSWAIVSTIPTLLIASLVLGYLAGRWADRRFHSEPWGLMAGLLLGLFVGGREAWRLFQQLSASEQDP